MTAVREAAIRGVRLDKSGARGGCMGVAARGANKVELAVQSVDLENIC